MRKHITLGFAVLLLSSSAALAQYQDQQRGRGEQYQSGSENRQVSDTPHWSRGDRLPQDFAKTNHVSDWQNQHLRRPARGYHWVRSGNDYVRATLGNGVIAEVVHRR
jgi:Ni/Co efflux regulator RcnB